jgi:hypothetical protein
MNKSSYLNSDTLVIEDDGLNVGVISLFVFAIMAFIFYLVFLSSNLWNYKFFEIFLLTLVGLTSLSFLYFGLINILKYHRIVLNKKTRKYKLIKKFRFFKEKVEEGSFDNFSFIEMRSKINRGRPSYWISIVKMNGRNLDFIFDSEQPIISNVELRPLVNSLLIYCDFFKIGFRLSLSSAIRTKLYSNFPELGRSKWNMD